MIDGEWVERFQSPQVSRFIEAYITLTNKLESLLWKVAIALAVVLVVIVSGQVFTRYALGFVPLWGGELARYLGIWIALLLTGAFIRRDKHLQVEVIFRRFSTRAQRIIRSIQLAIIALVGFFIANWGILYAVEQGFGFESPSMDFQMFWVYLGLPVCGVLIIFFALGKLLEINYDPETLERDYRMRFKIDEDAEESSMEELD